MELEVINLGAELLVSRTRIHATEHADSPCSELRLAPDAQVQPQVLHLVQSSWTWRFSQDIYHGGTIFNAKLEISRSFRFELLSLSLPTVDGSRNSFDQSLFTCC